MTPKQPTDLVAWRTSLTQTSSGYALLDAMISPPDAQRLVRALASDDLHALIHEIGLADCTELLALASGEQVRDILDLEIWERDNLSVERLDPWLQALMRSGPDVLGPRLLKLDDELLTWIIRRSVQVVVLEDPEDFSPPEAEHVVTPDGRMVVLFPESAERDLPAKIFLDWMMRVDAAHCINLLLASSAALDGQLQHLAHRWRSGRIADRGYVDYYDALVIYTAPPKTPVSTRPAKSTGTAPQHWLTPMAGSSDRLERAFATLTPEELESIQAELGFVANMVLSADRIEPWDFEGQEAALTRLRAGLALGLEALDGHDAQSDADLLYEASISLVFRHGYARMRQAVAPLQAVRARLRDEGNPIAAVDLRSLSPWAEALLTHRHPQRLDGEPLTTRADLEEAQRAAEQIANLVVVAGDAREHQGLAAWLTTQLSLHLLGLSGARLPVDRLGDAHRALFGGGKTITPEATASAILWWADRGGLPHALTLLLDEITAELGEVEPSALEPRFMRLFLLSAPD